MERADEEYDEDIDAGRRITFELGNSTISGTIFNTKHGDSCHPNKREAGQIWASIDNPVGQFILLNIMIEQMTVSMFQNWEKQEKLFLADGSHCHIVAEHGYDSLIVRRKDNVVVKVAKYLTSRFRTYRNPFIMLVLTTMAKKIGQVKINCPCKPWRDPHIHEETKILTSRNRGGVTLGRIDSGEMMNSRPCEPRRDPGIHAETKILTSKKRDITLGRIDSRKCTKTLLSWVLSHIKNHRVLW